MNVFAMPELNLQAHVNSVRAGQGTAKSSVSYSDGVHAGLIDRDGQRWGRVCLLGTMIGSSDAYVYGQWTDTNGTRDIVEALADDPSVAGIELVVCSSGGSCSGVDDLAASVRTATGKKPVECRIEDTCASAAYYVASQASKIIANPAALVGSIGIYSVVYDFSEMLSRDGVAVHVIRSGQHKGAGAGGSKISPEHIAEMERVVGSMHGLFVDNVMRGRRLSKANVEAVSDGRVFIASDALRLGLVDEIRQGGRTVSTRSNRPDPKAERREAFEANVRKIDQHPSSIAKPFCMTRR